MYDLGIYSFALTGPVWYMMGDIGKSGTDDGPPTTNPKYGGAYTNMCAEVVSWYYHDRRGDYQWYEEEFRDISSHASLKKVFEDSNRLYCYYPNHPVCGDGFARRTGPGVNQYECYTPQPSDYLWFWYPSAQYGLAMMIAHWVEGPPGLYGDYAVVLESAFPVRPRKVNVGRGEVFGWFEYCIGKIAD